MAQNISELLSLQQLCTVLGYSLSSEDLQYCLKQVQSLTPKVGKFWQGTDVEPGIYIVLAGKVRLLDDADELIATLDVGESFAEFTLFQEVGFKPYAARASVNLHLAFLPNETLSPLIAKYPQIYKYLRTQAQARNSLLVKSDSEPPSLDLPSQLPQQEEPISDRPAPKPQKKIGKAYFPSPTQKVGHLWQRVTKRYPFFAQQSASDCGAACLVMVSRYWGKRFSVNRVRDIANVDRNGASLRGLSVAAESIGFNTRPVKASLDQLGKQKLPAIVHWQGRHYIVVYEITNKYVIVADPAIGQRTLTHREFKADWTGYTLLGIQSRLDWIYPAIRTYSPFKRYRRNCNTILAIL